MKEHNYCKRLVSDLIPYINNSRTHSDEQVNQVASSIKEFGFTNPVLIDDKGGLIAGHGRIMAAKKLGINEVPCVELKGLTEAQKKAYVIADNQLAMNSGWDLDVLKLEVQNLTELDFDLDLLGFDDDFMGSLLDVQIEDGLTDEDSVPEPPEKPVSVLGDIWQLGNHRLMCGDSTSIDDVDNLIGSDAIDMVMTDPPYGISIVSGGSVGGDKAFGSVGGSKVVKAGNYAPIKGDNSIDVAVSAINIILSLDAKVSIIWGGNYYAQSLPNSSCWIVWDKQNTGNFADCELAWTNQKTAVRMFKHTWNGMIKASEHGQKRVHPTQKPAALGEWCIDNYGSDSKTILDLFGGSGSTLIACESKGKSCFMMEFAEHYVDVIIKRWQEFTGKEAVHIESGKTYNEMAVEAE